MRQYKDFLQNKLRFHQHIRNYRHKFSKDILFILLQKIYNKL